MTQNTPPIPQTEQDLLDTLKGLERFIARRFDEISMEINATAQQLDMAEGGLTGKFSEVLSVLSAVSHAGGTTQANTGLELESVIAETDRATHAILDATTAITNLIEGDLNTQSIDDIRNELNNIVMACSFQDLTSQRIRKAVENIHTVEETLSGTLEKMGIEVENKSAQTISQESRTSSQADIDALFD